MTLEQFISNNRGIDNNKDIPREVPMVPIVSTQSTPSEERALFRFCSASNGQKGCFAWLSL